MKKILLLLSFITFSGYADNFSCPGTFAYVATGYTVNQVVAICGLPTKQISTKQQPAGPKYMEEWIYNKNQFQSRTVVSLSAYNAGQHQLMVLLYNRKVVSIALDGQEVKSTNYCGGILIQVGNPATQVNNACGVATQSNLIPANLSPIEITKLTYQRQPYLPATTFVFQNGKLAEKIN